jgi:hypothetical protein
MICITQWLCPMRHCSIALAWDSKQTNMVEIEDRGEELYRSGKINRRCGICGEGLTVEHGRTKFKTLKEAMRPLVEIELENLKTRARLLAQRN